MTPTSHSQTRIPVVRPIAVAVFLYLITPAAWSQSSQAIYEGFTEPRYDIMVAATEIGRLEEVMVEVGDRVTPGETIARLEDSLQVSSVKMPRMQASMQGEVKAAKAEAALQRIRCEQLRVLAADKMARPDELNRAEADLEIAEARHLTAIEQQKLRQLELERNQLQLGRRRVTAPMGGIVSKVFHRAGEYITPGDPAVIRLLVVDQIFAVFNVPAEEVGKINLGDGVEVFLRSSSRSVAGRIHSIAPDIHGESGTVEVKVALDNQKGKLRVGDRCTMQIRPSSKVARLPRVVPRSSSK